MAAILKLMTTLSLRHYSHTPSGEYSWRVGVINITGNRSTSSSGTVSIQAAEGETPRLLTVKHRSDLQAHKNADFWIYKMKVYLTHDLELTPKDVLALVSEESNRRRLRLEKAHALQAMTAELDTKNRRIPLSQDVKVLVWQRDSGRCVECDSQKNLEFDHVIPLAMGGSNTTRNLQLLCESCNRRKGPTLG